VAYLYILDYCIWVNPVNAQVGTSAEHVVDVSPGPLNIPIDIHGESRSFRSSKPEVKRNGTRDATQTDENAPAIVHMDGVVKAVRYDGIFVYTNNH
jgi:hypothetical protein